MVPPLYVALLLISIISFWVSPLTVSQFDTVDLDRFFFFPPPVTARILVTNERLRFDHFNADVCQRLQVSNAGK